MPNPDAAAPTTAGPQTREQLVSGLVRIGRHGIAEEDDAAVDAYFADGFVFHGPDSDLDLSALKSFWASMRAAFDAFSVTRGHVVVDGAFAAAQTRMSGVFEREFTQSPVGPLAPTGEPFTLDLLNIFRYDDAGRLAEEWAQFDTRGMLRQLGAPGR